MCKTVLIICTFYPVPKLLCFSAQCALHIDIESSSRLMPYVSANSCDQTVPLLIINASGVIDNRRLIIITEMALSVVEHMAVRGTGPLLAI